MPSTLGARNFRSDTDTCELALRFSCRCPPDTGVFRCCSSVSIRQEVERLRHLWMPEDRSASSQWISHTVSLGARAVEKVTRYCMRIETVPSEGRGQTSWRWTGSIPLHVERTLLPDPRCLTPAVRGTTRCGLFDLLIPCVFCRWLAYRKLTAAGRTESDIRLNFYRKSRYGYLAREYWFILHMHIQGCTRKYRGRYEHCLYMHIQIYTIPQ